MNMSDRDRKFLWSRAGNRCSYNFKSEKCNVELLKYVNGNLTALGEECHIVGETEKAPRYVAAFSERMTYYNMILLCKEHHKIIDENADVHTVKSLHEMKDQHEEAVEQAAKQDPNKPPLKINDEEFLKAVKRSQRTAEI